MFVRAAATDRLVLLSITTSWSARCAAMDREVYGDRRVSTAIAERVLPVRVDADARPDVAIRYSLGDWPTTVLLTPSGDILGGGTVIGSDRLLAALDQATAAWRERRRELEARARQARAERAARRARLRAAAPDKGAVDWTIAALHEAFDPVHGGFDQAPKLPHPEALDFLLAAYCRRPSDGVARLIRDSLDALVTGGLHDRVEGGFFRACSGADWSAPDTAKLTEINAALLSVLLDAWETFGVGAYRTAAEGIVRYVRATLAAPEGGFYSSQRPDAAYYGRAEPAARRALPAPPVDPTLYADDNGLMAAAFLRAARGLSDPALAAAAIEALEQVVAAVYRRGEGLAHRVGASDDEPRGLLADQVAVSGALVDAYDASGRPVYLDLAAELMLFARRHLWDPVGGGFCDRVCDPRDPGLLAEPVVPFTANCEAARVLARLASRMGRDDLRADAVDTLAVLARHYRGYGVAGAPYARACLDVVGSGSRG